MANPEFEMPTLREIEIDLALGSDSWQSLLATHSNQHPLPQAGALWKWFRGRQSTLLSRFEQALSRP